MTLQPFIARAAKHGRLLGFAAALALAVSAGMAVSDHAVAGSAAAKQAAPAAASKITLTAVNLNADKSDAAAVILGRQLIKALPDAKVIFGGPSGENARLGASYMDAGRRLLAVQIDEDCGTMGCQTFIFYQVDPAKNQWVRAYDNLAHGLWVVNGTTGTFKIVMQSLFRQAPSTWELVGNKFVPADPVPLPEAGGSAQ